MSEKDQAPVVSPLSTTITIRTNLPPTNTDSKALIKKGIVQPYLL
jgi:hypothetical protein